MRVFGLSGVCQPFLAVLVLNNPSMLVTSRPAQHCIAFDANPTVDKLSLDAGSANIEDRQESEGVLRIFPGQCRVPAVLEVAGLRRCLRHLSF